MVRKQVMILMISSSIVMFSLLLCECGAEKGPNAVEKWFRKLPNAKQKVSKVHFYFHDVVSGKHPTSIPVARANSTSKSPTFLGLLSVIDNPLTVRPGPKSKIIGRAQGITGYTSSEDLCLLMTLNLVFTAGKYNGSTLSVVGYNPINHEYREMAVVGGSGLFRLAQGIATAETAKFNPRSGNAVVEYNVMVLHY